MRQLAVSSDLVKRVVRVKLLPTPLQAGCRRSGIARRWAARSPSARLTYKARRAGVPFLEVDPAHTSQRCPRCGHTERANRRTRDHVERQGARRDCDEQSTDVSHATSFLGVGGIRLPP
ncbi:zinc ribbon domain-containing protein [Streptomyces sp. NPDC055103]